MHKQQFPGIGLVAFLLCLLQTHLAYAAIRIYEEKALFLSETGAVDVIDSYPVTGTQVVPYTFQDGVEDITISAQSFFTGEATGLLSDIELRISAGAEVINSENIDVTLAGERYGFGFDLVEPSTNAGAPFVESIFRVILLNNREEVDSFTFAPPNDIAYFIGIWSDEPFTEVKIREIVGSNENEHYGHFYTSSKIPNDITRLKTSPLGKLLPEDGVAVDKFGHSMAMDGDTLLVGALLGDGYIPDSGAAYVFIRQGSSWIQQAKLVANDGAGEDGFGWSVALSGDTALIGAYADDDNGNNSGSAYIFVRQGNSWIQQTKLVPTDGAEDHLFGYSLVISGDTALIGAAADDDNDTDSGSVYVFARQGNSWTQQTKLLADDGAAGDLFGVSLSLSGDTVLIGARLDDDNGNNSGSAYVFTGQGNSWTQQAKLVATDGEAEDVFGYSVALSGNTALVGAAGDDDNGPTSGSAYVFVREGTSWTKQAKLLAADGFAEDLLGYSVALSGDTALIGALGDDDKGPTSGSAYVFTRQGTGWNQKKVKLIASDGASGDQFGGSVVLYGDVALVGAEGDDDNGGQSGSAYVATLYERIGKGLSPALQAAVIIAVKVGQKKQTQATNPN